MGKTEDYFKQGISREELSKIREALLLTQGNSDMARMREIRPQFPTINVVTLEGYSRMVLGATNDTFQAYMDEKISLRALQVLSLWEAGDQAFMLEEYITRKMQPEALRKVRRIKKEQGCGFAEAIAKAMGEMPVHGPREAKPRSFDTLLDDINKHSARWRGLLSMAFDMVGKEEAQAGVHDGLFQKAYLLRHVINENYEFANSRVKRYFNFIKKKYGAAAETSSTGQEFMEGADHGDTAGAGEEGGGREAGASGEDGPPVPNQPV